MSHKSLAHFPKQLSGPSASTPLWQIGQFAVRETHSNIASKLVCLSEKSSCIFPAISGQQESRVLEATLPQSERCANSAGPISWDKALKDSSHKSPDKKATNHVGQSFGHMFFCFRLYSESVSCVEDLINGCDKDNEDINYARHIIAALNQGLGALCEDQATYESKRIMQPTFSASVVPVVLIGRGHRVTNLKR